MEPLIRNIEANQEIDSLRSNLLDSNLPKSLAYADDLTCIVKNNQGSILNVFREYERLSKLSGLQLNADKTDFLIIQSSGLRPPNEFVDFVYLNKRYSNRAKEEIKINGLFFQMNRERMRTKNVDHIVSKIESQLWKWSKRGLSTLGKILVLKTFGVSQLIYLMQSMSLKNSDFKKFNAILYKFIWNKHFGAAKAPDRIKREIINTPIEHGGFGMIDIEALDRSLKLKMLARLTVSTHPFLVAIMRKINLNEFFYPVSNQKMDKPINQAVSFLYEDRQHLLTLDVATKDKKLISLIREIRIRDIVTVAGMGSLIFFELRRAGKRVLRDLSMPDLNRLNRLLKNRHHLQVYRTCLALNVPRPDVNDSILYWSHCLKPLTKLSSKEFRTAHSKSLPLCTYKIGAVLSPIENSSWTYKLRKLTSTRHKNLILKIAHGDWYSKDRLFRFGLINDPLCDSCGLLETIRHKVLECPGKLPIWQALARQENVDITNMIDPIEFVLGMHKHECPDSLTIHAELLSRVLYNPPGLPPDRIIEITKAKLARIDPKIH